MNQEAMEKVFSSLGRLFVRDPLLVPFWALVNPVPLAGSPGIKLLLSWDLVFEPEDVLHISDPELDSLIYYLVRKMVQMKAVAESN